MTPQERKVKVLEQVENKLSEAQQLLDEDEFTDEEVDEIYGAISSTISVIEDIISRNEASKP